MRGFRVQRHAKTPSLPRYATIHQSPGSQMHYSSQPILHNAIQRGYRSHVVLQLYMCMVVLFTNLLELIILLSLVISYVIIPYLHCIYIKFKMSRKLNYIYIIYIKYFFIICALHLLFVHQLYTIYIYLHYYNYLYNHIIIHYNHIIINYNHIIHN